MIHPIAGSGGAFLNNPFFAMALEMLGAAVHLGLKKKDAASKKKMV